MTDKEKAKAYYEALERAKNWKEKYSGSTISEDGTMMKDFDNIFPELAESPSESEDERIRKVLMDIVGRIVEKCFTEEGVTKTSVLAWLEEQKEVDVLDEEERAFADNVDSFRNACDEAYQTGYRQGIKSEKERWLEKQKEQKPVGWSKEDEVYLNIIIEDLKELYKKRKAAPDSVLGKSQMDNISWFKSLPNRFQLQLKQEWSEEDEQLLGFIFDLLESLEWREEWAMGKKECLERITNLRPSWKPSEEQIVAFNYAYCELFKRKDVGHQILGPLGKLGDDLNKLR